MRQKKLRPGLKNDSTAAGAPLVLGAVAVIVVIIVAVMILWWYSSPRDDLVGGDPKTAQGVVYADVKIGDFDNQVGSVEVRDVTTKVTGETWNGGYHPSMSIWEWFSEASWFYAGGEFTVWLEVKINGPGIDAHDADQWVKTDVEDIQVDELTPFSKNKVAFDTITYYTPGIGTYHLDFKIYVDSDDEGVDNELCWSGSKSITVP